MKLRLVKDSTVFLTSYSSRQFDSNNPHFAEWECAYTEHAVYLKSPAAGYIVIPLANIEYLEFTDDEADTYEFPAIFYRVRPIDRLGDIPFVAVGSDDPERLRELEALIGQAPGVSHGDSAKVSDGPGKKESGDMHETGGEDIRLQTPRRRGRPRK